MDFLRTAQSQIAWGLKVCFAPDDFDFCVTKNLKNENKHSFTHMKKPMLK
jgi:hypothetical protein